MVLVALVKLVERLESPLKRQRVKVPQQVAVIGFSNWFMSQVLTPKLSTIDQPSHEMGVASFNLLLEEMHAHKENIPFTPKTIILETSVIERDSSKKS